METSSDPSPSHNSNHNIVKFDATAIMKPPHKRNKPRQISSVSLMTAETTSLTAESEQDFGMMDNASLTDDDDDSQQHSLLQQSQSEAQRAVHHLLDELVGTAVLVTTSTSSSAKNEEADEFATTAAVPLDAATKVALLLRQNTNDAPPLRRSILKGIDVEIPVRNTKWKTLPKLDMDKINTQPTVAARTRRRKKKTKTITFQAVLIRCYDVTIGDNPAVSYGTPVQLDWHYEQLPPLDLEAYETSRTRRPPRQMMMNYYNRRNLLINRFGYSEQEVVAAEKAANKIRTQRSLTRALLPTAMLEDLVSSAARKTKRLGRFGGGGKKSKERRSEERTQ